MQPLASHLVLQPLQTPAPTITPRELTRSLPVMSIDPSSSAGIPGSLVLRHILSSTSTGTLYYAQDTNSGSSYSVKGLSHRGKNEARVYKSLASLDLPSIQKHYITFKNDGHTYSIMDYHDAAGSLATAIQDDTFHGHDELLKSTFTQLVDAVKGCHEVGVYHRDLRPSNVFLVGEDKKVVLGNFAHARKSSHSTSCPGEDEAFMSPGESSFYFVLKVIPLTDVHPVEMLDADGSMDYSNSAADVWSLGITLFSMITAQQPWSSASLEDNNENFDEFLSDPTFFVKKFLLSIEASTLR